MTKTITIRVDSDTFKEIKTHAEIERRPLSNFIEYATVKYIEESAFTDDEEMLEVLSNEELLKRLKKGSADARKKRGKFIK
jgi:predicted transcriptional regulator